MKVVITIPTFNEVENIGPMIEALQSEFKKMLKHDFFILVIDDSSPDGTADVVTKMAHKMLNVHLLKREEKEGLGAAYAHGFHYAINMMDADVIVEMDADFQHDPKDVIRLVAKLDEGFDYVIGSRFTEGGSIPESWGFYRKFLSKGGSQFCKIVLGTKNINDFTSGFKASRVKNFVDKINLKEIRSQGFAYKIDLLYKMYKMNAKIVEVPIAFGVRDRGDSKMELSNFLDSLFLVIKIRALEFQSFLLFLVVGTIGLIVDLGIFNLFIFLSQLNLIDVGSQKLPTGALASLISGFVAMFTTFVLNNRWTFGDRKLNSVTQFATSIIIYYMSSYIPIIFRSWLVKYAVGSYGDTFLVNNGALFIGIFFGLIWNFTVYSKFIWKKEKAR